MQIHPAPYQPASPPLFGWQPHGNRTQSLHDALKGNGHLLPHGLYVREANRSALSQWKHIGGASTVIALEEALRQVEDWYLLPEPEPVRMFLRRHPSLATLLVEALDWLYRLFGPTPQVSLRVVTDPEVEDFDQLFACIHATRPVEEARRQLRQLDREWFLDQFDRAAGVFNFILEFS